MAGKKKSNSENNSQINLFNDNKVLNEKKISSKGSARDIGKGEMLEYQMKRLFFFMGYYTKTNIVIQTTSDEPFDVVTDLDVYGNYIHLDFSQKTIWADCKSGAAQEVNRVAWLIGIKDMIKVDDILFVKKGTKLSTKMFANTKNIQIVDLNIISDMEKKYGIKSNDWRSSWNPAAQDENIKIFKSILTPNNLIYKRIFKFINTHYWAIEDSFTKCKKTITALRDLSSLVELPLSEVEKKSIKWAIYQLSGMLMLSMLQICRQVHYYTNSDKAEIIVSGLVYGSNSKTRIDDILKVTNNIAKKTLLKYSIDENRILDVPEIKLYPPDYTEAFVNIIMRITEQPKSYFDILRFLDFSLFQYDLYNTKYNIDELNDIFDNSEELLKSSKTFLHFLCYITNIPKDVFILLNDN